MAHAEAECCLCAVCMLPECCLGVVWPKGMLMPLQHGPYLSSVMKIASRQLFGIGQTEGLNQLVLKLGVLHAEEVGNTHAESSYTWRRVGVVDLSEDEIKQVAPFVTFGYSYARQEVEQEPPQRYGGVAHQQVGHPVGVGEEKTELAVLEMG